MMKKYSIVALGLILLGFFSCKKETGDPINMGFDFFPLEQSNYSIYQVDSIVWDDFNATLDTFHSEVKLLVDSAFIDNEGNPSYRWKKYVATDTMPFTFVANYTITKTNQNLETVEENMRYTKLIFPVIAGASWDYNAKNTGNAKSSQYSDVDYSTTILNHTYDSCALATYEEEVNLIQEFVHYAIYARNVGMVYSKEVHKQKLSTGLSGYSVIYQLKEYGKN